MAKISVRYPNTFTTAGVCASSRGGIDHRYASNIDREQHMRTTDRPEGGYRYVLPAEVRPFRNYCAGLLNTL